MTQLERISYYENILNEATALVDEVSAKLYSLLELKNKIKELEKYLYSEERNIDLRADEEGLLPKDLPRGVLGEDYIYDMLIRYDEIKDAIKKL